LGARPAPRRHGERRRRRVSLGRGDPGRRLGISLLCIVFVLSLFVGRLIQLQGIDSAGYKEAAEKEQIATTTLPAVRGSITAADGQTLAMTVQTYTIVADPGELKPAQRVSDARKLAGPLHTTAAALEYKLAHPSSSQYEVLATGVSASVGQQITAENLPQIDPQATYTREVTPDGESAADIVGFTSSSNAGVGGIEQEYNALLSGHNGSEQAEIGSNGQTIPLAGEKISPAVNGDSIKLTIIPSLQWEAEQACKQRVAQTHAKSCTIVIIQPKTGYILAMAQWPTYTQTDSSYPTNLALQDVFEPGSTAKVITAAAAFEHGGQTPMSPYNIPFSINEGGLLIHDAEWHYGERYTIAGIIANSSNVGMSQVATHISAQTQYDYLRAFGLGQPTGVNLPGESSGILHPLSQYWESLKYTLAYGQGVDVTALQMAEVYATIANGGVHVAPTLVAGVTDSSGHYTQTAPGATKRVIAAKTAKELTQILQQVPAVDEEADQPWGIIPGYAVAMKTGTSDESGANCPHSLCNYGSSLIGMAPGSNAQVVVAVNVQDPSKANDDYFGDIVAGPVFYSVMKDALQALQIAPPGDQVPKVRLNAP
jgi:cell division protein FtsI (penicillin-binding protein 3)